MVTPPEAHDVAVLPAWYAPSPRKVAIHRYLDAGFVAQFQADAGNAPQRNPALFEWEQEDRMGPEHGNLLKLRRPVHRTFHVVAWEASCKISTAPSGQPALAPEKIESAGFVLRTGDPGAPQGFQLVRGKSQGWSTVEPGVDPDAVRQVKALGVLLPQPATPASAYTGEETFPLHPLAVEDGATAHTLLFGYLPIGGGDYVPAAPAAPPAPDTGNVPEDLPWPFGLADRSNGPPPVYSYDQQITAGQIASQLGAVLRVLLGRYQFVEPAAWTDPANATIVGILDTLNFYTDPPPALAGRALRDWAAAHHVPGFTLGSVLRDSTTAQNLLTASMKAAPTDRVPLPATARVPMGGDNLLVTETVAAQVRAAMRLRLAQAIATSTAAIPVPKLTSGPSGRYFLVPFVRTVKPDGCPRISWGAPSEPFAVAAAFDPDAARPSLIEMPGLADAKKGLARGATFDMPPDLANLANSLSNNAAVQAMWGGNGSAPGGGGVRFICSFSLPVISICAMVMLSIVISLLNIFLGWMAWVKICLPVPSKK
jgi:hypothetical protein